MPAPDAFRRAFLRDRLEPRRPSDVGQGRFRRTVALFPYGQRALQIPCRYYYLRGQTFLPPFRGRSAGARPRRAAEPRFGKGGQRRQHAYDADDPPEPRPESEDLPGKDRRGGAGDPAGIQMRQGGDTRPVRLPRPLRRQCDRTGERRMVLFRPQRRQPLVGRERHARRTAELARAHPYQAQPGTVAAQAGRPAGTDMARRAYRLPDVRSGPAGTAARRSRTDADAGDAPAGADARGIAPLDARL